MSKKRAVIVTVVLAILGIAAGWGLGGAGAAKPAVFTGLVAGVAVGGHDPVAYFAEGKPVVGNPQITLKHDGATWRFSSEDNRRAFQADPAKFAPRYGGYCAYAVAQGYTAKGNPEAWSIVDGRLYLNYDKNVRRTWEQDTAGNIRAGDAHWPAVLSK